MQKLIKLGLIGLGYWGPNLLRNFSVCEDCSVTVCCDLNPKRWKNFEKLYPLTKFVTDVNELFSDTSLDGILIATPVHTHYELAKKALLNKKHVLVEKPLALSVNEAVELHELSISSRLVLQLDHVFVYSPAVQRLKSIVDSGALGSIYFIDSIRINLGLFQEDVNVLWDLAPHDLSIVDSILNRLPLSLSASGSSHTESGREDIAYLNLDYGNSLIASFHVSWLSPVKVRTMMIGGSKQTLIYNDLDNPERLKVYERGISVNAGDRNKQLVNYRMGDMMSPYVSTEEPLSIMAADFIQCIRTGKKPVADSLSGVRITQILSAAEESLRGGSGKIYLADYLKRHSAVPKGPCDK